MSSILVQGVYPQAVALIALSAAALLLDIPPLIWHVKNCNFATATLTSWIMLANLINLVNASIWPNDRVVIGAWLGYGLCDIEAKLILGSWLAVPGAVACIMCRLAAVMDTRYTTLYRSKAQKTREIALQVTLCWIGPLYLFAVHYVVQPNRYYLYAISGCNPSFDNSWPSIVLVFVWPLVFAILDTYYAVLLILRVYRYRTAFDTLLRNSNTTKSRFLRLWIMSTLLVVIMLPLQIFIFYENVSFPRLKYSWDLVHGSNWNTVQVIPSLGRVVFDRWISVGCGFLVFIFFGTGRDAKTMYKAWFTGAQRRLRWIPFPRGQFRWMFSLLATPWKVTGSKRAFTLPTRWSGSDTILNTKSSNQAFKSVGGSMLSDSPEIFSPSNVGRKETSGALGIETHKQARVPLTDLTESSQITYAAVDSEELSWSGYREFN